VPDSCPIFFSPGSRDYGGRHTAGVVRWLSEDLGLDLHDGGGAVQPSQCNISSGSSVLEQQQYPLSLWNQSIFSITHVPEKCQYA